MCASICALIDEMNSGSGKLILAVADLPSRPFLVLFLCALSSRPLIPPRSSLSRSPVGSSHLFSLTDVEGRSRNGKRDNINKSVYLVLRVLLYLTRCLLAQVKPLHHFCLFFLPVSFYLLAKSSVFFENL